MVVIGTQNISVAWDNLFVDLIVDGDLCHFTHVAPATLDAIALSAYAIANEAKYAHDIIRDMYPVRPVDVNSLGEVEAWVAAGVDVPDKIPFARAHSVQKTFSEITEDSVNIQTAIDQIADPDVKNTFQLILDSKVKKVWRQK